MCRLSLVFTALALLAAAPLHAQDDPSRLTVDRIFRDADFSGAPMPAVHWLADGRSYIDLRENDAGASDIVRVDLVTGEVTVMAAAASLRDERGEQIEVESLELSEDESRALLFHDSERVWRDNTLGVYHVYEFATRRVIPVSRSGGKQMFAKFSADARQVAFVRDNDLWVSDLAAGTERRLTTDGSDVIINGTTDWVYEEELGLRDAFRWSPDGRRIAYWRFDQSPVPWFPLVDELSLYPEIERLRYPKAGERNSIVRVGVLDVAGARTQWLSVGPDTGQYIARMEWKGSDSLVVQRLPRRQNQLDLLMVSATTGQSRTILTDRDSAYVDVEDQPFWLAGDRQFLWLSDRTGWRQVFLHDRAGRMIRQVTRDGMDIISVEAVDERNGWVYVIAAAPSPTQRQLYRFSIDGRRSERVTQQPGAHRVTIGPGARWMVDVHTTANVPAVASLYELPVNRRSRVIQDNAELVRKVASLRIRAPEFFRMPMPDGTVLDAYRIVPADFDSTRRHPVVMFVYGGPASPTVNDAFGGNRYLWHQYLAQQGFVVVSADNRGAAWRGRDFRKITQLDLGRWESQDQIDAARWVGRQRWADPSRIAIWGWSYGGYMSSLAAAKGGDVYRAAIVVAPVSDWRFYDTIYTERYMWTPQGNPEGYRRSSPIAHVGTLTAPLLLVHGTGDDNVHAQHTLALAEALQDAGKPFWMLMYPNKTHSISGAATQAHLYTSMSRFLVETMRPAAGVPASGQPGAR